MASAIAAVAKHIISVTKAIMPTEGKAPNGAAEIGRATYDIGRLTNAIKAKESQNGGRSNTRFSPEFGILNGLSKNKFNPTVVSLAHEVNQVSHLGLIPSNSAIGNSKAWSAQHDSKARPIRQLKTVTA